MTIVDELIESAISEGINAAVISNFEKLNQQVELYRMSLPLQLSMTNVLEWQIFNDVLMYVDDKGGRLTFDKKKYIANESQIAEKYQAKMISESNILEMCNKFIGDAQSVSETINVYEKMSSMNTIYRSKIDKLKTFIQ
jgi:hypothetical protein